jgi:hypothetical protein
VPPQRAAEPDAAGQEQPEQRRLASLAQLASQPEEQPLQVALRAVQLLTARAELPEMASVLQPEAQPPAWPPPEALQAESGPLLRPSFA